MAWFQTRALLYKHAHMDTAIAFLSAHAIHTHTHTHTHSRCVVTLQSSSSMVGIWLKS
jgi:hypothetical protein